MSEAESEPDPAYRQRVDHVSRPVALMREALTLLDQSGRTQAGDFLEHVIVLIEEDMWRAAGIQTTRGILQ